MPFFQRDAEVNIHYEIQGQGEPVLLIHGFMGTGATEFASFVPMLAKRYRLILPDIRGYGQSTPKPRRYGVDFYRQDAEDMAALLEHLNLPSVAVIGYSDGGEIGLWMPILAPERIKGVIVWGATGHFDPSIRGDVLSIMSLKWRTPQMDALHGAEHIREMANRWVASMLGMIDAGGDVTYSQAGKIRCPVLVMIGDRDSMNPAEAARRMAEAIPQGQFSLYRKTGHRIHLERPRPFQREMLRFLKRLG